VDEAEKEGVELVEAGTDGAEALEPPEQAFDLVAPLAGLPVVGPGIAPGLERWTRGREPEITRSLTRFIAFAGADTMSALATEAAQQRAPDRGRARRSRPSGHPRQPHEA